MNISKLNKVPVFGNKSLLYKLLLLVFTLLLGVGLAMVLNQYQSMSQQNTAIWLHSPDCQLDKSSCIFQGNPNSSHPIKLSLSSPQSIMPMEELTLNVSWPGQNAKKLSLSLTGADMYMGEVRFTLEQQSSGHYQSHFYLPVCTTGAMTWQGNILPVTTDKPLPANLSYGIEFQLISSK